MVTVIDKDAGGHIDQPVVLDGTAYDAHAGAVVMLADNMPVYISGLEEWDDAFFKQRVRVSGTLRRRKLGPDPEVNKAGEVSHGIEGTDFVLDEPNWSLAE